MTDLDAQRVIEECPERLRDDLKRLLDNTGLKGPESVFIGGRKVLNRPDGWYSSSKAGDSLITDALVQLTCEATDSSMKNVFWYGEIKYGNNRIVFTGEPFHEIDKDPLTWLRDKTARTGLGYPRFDRSWARHFTNLVKSFSTGYRRALVTERLGLNDSGDLIFPCFVMHNGEITEQKQIPPSGMPALSIHPPVLRTMASPEPVTAARASWFAAAAAFVSRLLGKHDCPVYITEGTAARSGIMSFVDSADMLSRTFSRGTGDEQRELRQLMDQFGYPAHLRASNDILNKLLYENYSSAFLSTSRLAAASLCTKHDGIILRDAALKDGEEMPPFDDVLWYLADLQKRGFQLPEGSGLAGLLRDLCQFMCHYLPSFDTSHAAIATGQIRVCQKAGDSLIELLALLCLSAQLEVEYVDLQPCLDQACPPKAGKKAICVDSENSRVYLSRGAIGRACDRAGIPRPELHKAEKELSGRKLLLPNPLSDGILISTELWEGAIKGCRRELNTGV
jgi:hypothetical protein